jgi:hypothetical protein
MCIYVLIKDKRIKAYFFLVELHDALVLVFSEAEGVVIGQSVWWWWCWVIKKKEGRERRIPSLVRFSLIQTHSHTHAPKPLWCIYLPPPFEGTF